MKKWLIKAVFVLFFLLIPYSSLYAQKKSFVPREEWMPRKGDFLIIDTTYNYGYVFRQNKKEYTAFPLITGQRRNVCYIGKCYYAETPEKKWVIKEKNIQPDRTTFGTSGEFLRLYSNGERTHYGIHGHRFVEKMMEKESSRRFRSMGCVIVRDEVFDFLENLFLFNGKSLNVITTKNLGKYFFLF